MGGEGACKGGGGEGAASSVSLKEPAFRDWPNPETMCVFPSGACRGEAGKPPCLLKWNRRKEPLKCELVLKAEGDPACNALSPSLSLSNQQFPANQ